MHVSNQTEILSYDMQYFDQIVMENLFYDSCFGDNCSND